MARTTIGEIVSETRKAIHAVKADALMTDRYIYKLLMKHAKMLLKREDRDNKLMRFNGSFQFLEEVDLQEVDRVSAGCSGIKSGVTIRKSIKKLPTFMNGYWGPLVRSISSLDGSQGLNGTDPVRFTKIANSKNYRYNNTLYYWISDDHLFCPNIEWDSVMIEGLFEDDISEFQCGGNRCIPRQEQPFNIPAYLHPEIQAMALQEFMGTARILPDPVQDKQSPTR